jgi:hypothetical protein
VYKKLLFFLVHEEEIDTWRAGLPPARGFFGP